MGQFIYNHVMHAAKYVSLVTVCQFRRIDALMYMLYIFIRWQVLTFLGVHGIIFVFSQNVMTLACMHVKCMHAIIVVPSWAQSTCKPPTLLCFLDTRMCVHCPIRPCMCIASHVVHSATSMSYSATHGPSSILIMSPVPTMLPAQLSTRFNPVASQVITPLPTQLNTMLSAQLHAQLTNAQFQSSSYNAQIISGFTLIIGVLPSYLPRNN